MGWTVMTTGRLASPRVLEVRAVFERELEGLSWIIHGNEFR